MIKKILICLWLILAAGWSQDVFSQEKLAPNRYWVQFADKNGSPFQLNAPEMYLSTKAIERRNRSRIPIRVSDLPVNPSYLDSLRRCGATVLNRSRWFNAATIECSSDSVLDLISKLSFVTKRSAVKYDIPEPTSNLAFAQVKLNPPLKHWRDTLYRYGSSENQIMMLKGHILHNNGYRGEGMTIAVLDGGFYHANELPAFDSICANKQIMGAIDFAFHQDDVYKLSDHGMKCLSTIGGNMPGQLIGTAPKASFWLLRSEETESENLVEEANWISAAEFADSVGVDIISSSLGYYKFDMPELSHKREDCDGGHALVSLGADMASSKGILVVNSAGNEGSDPWHYVTPAGDGRYVLTVGAVDFAGNHAYFSSFGPSADGRIKPDVCARGVSASVQGTNGYVGKSSGTSFSCPITSGMVACLWQAFPSLSNIDIIELIRKSSSQYFAPDSILGYGIPDYAKAFEIMNNYSEKSLYYQEKTLAGNNPWMVFPNPFSDLLELQFRLNSFAGPQESELQNHDEITVNLADLTGRSLHQYHFDLREYPYFRLPTIDLSTLSAGAYILQIKSPYGSGSQKIFKNN